MIESDTCPYCGGPYGLNKNCGPCPEMAKHQALIVEAIAIEEGLRSESRDQVRSPWDW